MNENGNGREVVVLNATVRPEHRAMIHQHAKDNGLISLSAALRLIIDEWAQFKAREAGVTAEG